MPLPIAFPSDFRPRTPQFGALVKGSIGDDEPIIVVQVGHGLSDFDKAHWFLRLSSEVRHDVFVRCG